MRSYDENAALEEYVLKHARSLMTGFERRCIELGVLQATAASSPSKSLKAYAAERWAAEGDEKIEEALACGVREFHARVCERLLRMAMDGELQVNRCPRCRRVVRTPTARQCRWCGRTWRAGRS